MILIFNQVKYSLHPHLKAEIGMSFFISFYIVSYIIIYYYIISYRLFMHAGKENINWEKFVESL